MGAIIYCGGCLSIDIKMCNLAYKDFSLRDICLDKINSHIDTGQYLCYECAAELEYCLRFKRKCIRAQIAISEAIHGNEIMTKDTLSMIDREKYNLVSRIGMTSTVCISYGDIHNVKQEEIPISIELSDYESDIKDEISIREESLFEKQLLIHDMHISIKTKNNDVSQSAKDKISNGHECFIVEDSLLNDKSQKIINSDTSTSSNIEIAGDTLTVSKTLFQRAITSKKSKAKNTATKRKPRTKQSLKPKSELHEYMNVVCMTTEEAMEELLLKKETNRYKGSPYKCMHCSKGFVQQTTFESHMVRHSDVSGVYTCDLCQYHYENKSGLLSHMYRVHRYKLCCKKCDFVCNNWVQASCHMKIHKGEQFTCGECGKHFSYMKSLIAHRRFSHVTRHMCDLCGRECVSAMGLRAHKRIMHPQAKDTPKRGPKCEDCDVHFATEEAWGCHLAKCLKNAHSQPEKGMQDAEGNPAPHDSGRGKQNYVTYPGPCRLCGKRMSTRFEYLNHTRKEHPKRKIFHPPRDVVCEQCGKVFQNIGLLKYHQNKHTGERPFKCTECPKAFAQPANLRRHSTVHSGIKAYDCDMCYKKFATPSSLLKHKKCHLNIRPHKCEMCEKRFIHACELRCHVQHAHDKVPYPKKRRKAKKPELDIHQ